MVQYFLTFHLESIGFITHCAKLSFNMSQLQVYKERLHATEKTLLDLYQPNFVTDTRLGALSTRLQRCHDLYFKSFCSGVPGIKVSDFSKLLTGEFEGDRR